MCVCAACLTIIRQAFFWSCVISHLAVTASDVIPSLYAEYYAVKVCPSLDVGLSLMEKSIRLQADLHTCCHGLKTESSEIRSDGINIRKVSSYGSVRFIAF